jgi:hypothetical protein
MTKEFWMNNQLSIARFHGGMTQGSKTWLIIPPLYDLVRQDFIKYYCKLGRGKFIEVLKEHSQATDKELETIFKELTKPKKAETIEEQTLNFE